MNTKSGGQEVLYRCASLLICCGRWQSDHSENISSISNILCFVGHVLPIPY